MNCKVCFEKFDLNIKIPLLLNCGHTFCAECIEEIKRKRKKSSDFQVICPICQAKNDFSNISEISKNFSLLELIDWVPEKSVEDGDDYKCISHKLPIIGFCSSQNSFHCTECLKKLPKTWSITDIETGCKVIRRILQPKANSFMTNLRKDELLLKRSEDVLKNNRNKINLFLDALEEAELENSEDLNFTTVGIENIAQIQESLISVDPNEISSQAEKLDFFSKPPLKALLEKRVFTDMIKEFPGFAKDALTILLKETQICLRTIDGKGFAPLCLKDDGSIWVQPTLVEKPKDSISFDSAPLWNEIESKRILEIQGKYDSDIFKISVILLPGKRKLETLKTKTLRIYRDHLVGLVNLKGSENSSKYIIGVYYNIDEISKIFSRVDKINETKRKTNQHNYNYFYDDYGRRVPTNSKASVEFFDMEKLLGYTVCLFEG